METWKDIPGTDYSVSSEGRVASRKFGKWRVLCQSQARGGYLMVHLCADGMSRPRKVHQLVAEAFLGPKPTSKHVTNHKNGVRSDNRAENFEWMTRSENNHHRYDVLKHAAAMGEACGTSKLTETKAQEIQARAAMGEAHAKIAVDCGVSRQTVWRVVRGKSWAYLNIPLAPSVTSRNSQKSPPSR